MKKMLAAVRQHLEAITDRKARELVKAYACDCLTPKEHDAVVALASQLPQVLPASAAGANQPGLVRVVDDPADWREILATNGECVRQTIATMESRDASLDLPDPVQPNEQIQPLFQATLASKPV